MEGGRHTSGLGNMRNESRANEVLCTTYQFFDFFSGVKERIRVQVFDENSRTAVYALENSKTTLSCYVEGKCAHLSILEGKVIDLLQPS